MDECLSNPCQNGGTCDDRNNGYVCYCPLGYAGIHCEMDIAVCDTGNQMIKYLPLACHSLTQPNIQEVEINVIMEDSALKDVDSTTHAIVHRAGRVAFAVLKLMNAKVHLV